ncbi:serine hydrolase domain-containing protein [Cryobacterium tagatosivorans]|nr:serine hydrolase domain-containing protein [Cryobacterium tagatosivorans]
MTAQIELSADVIDRLTHWFDDQGVVAPSLNYAIYDRSGILFHHGLGDFQRDGRRPEVDTIYRICSMTKSFLIATVLILRDRGLLSLEDPVSATVPEFPDFVDDSGARVPITLRMLMTNSSGLPEDNGWADFNLSITREGLRETLAAGLNFSDFPDSGYQYANIGFAVLGLVVEAVSGMPFDKFATATLLEPLGLTRSRFDLGDYDDAGEGGGGIAYGFESFDGGESWFRRPFTETGAMGAAGSLFSTLPDIARWSGWLSSAFDPANTDDAILSRASRRLMQRIFTPKHDLDRTLIPEIENVGYGLALIVEHDERFGSFAQHSGGLPGFSTHMRWHLSSGLGVALFGNTNSLDDIAIWSARLLRIVLEDRAVPAKTIPLWPATFSAAEELETAIRGSGNVVDAERLFSGNLLSDVPEDVRFSRLQAAVAAVGGLEAAVPPLAERLAWSVSAAQVAWTIPGRSGYLECAIEMTETQPSLIQRLDITARQQDWKPLPLISRHSRPLAPPAVDASAT